MSASERPVQPFRRDRAIGMRIDRQAAMNHNCKPTNTQRAMTIAKYRPHAVLASPFDQFVSEFLGRDIGHFIGHDDARSSTPSVNIVERDAAYELRLLAPGFAKEDLKLAMENEVLTISAEKKNEELKENERYTRREFRHNAFRRSFRLPETANVEQITAEHTNGVLVVNIPKAEAAKPKAREINIG